MEGSPSPLTFCFDMLGGKRVAFKNGHLNFDFYASLWNTCLLNVCLTDRVINTDCVVHYKETMSGIIRKIKCLRFCLLEQYGRINSLNPFVDLTGFSLAQNT